MTEEEGPPDPNLHPAKSPGVGPEEANDVTVSRSDVDIGSADPASLTAGDTEPVEDDSVEAVIATLSEESPTERKRAAIELGRRERRPDVVDALRRAAREDPDADVRQFAVESLGDHGGDVAESVALAALSDSDPWVRAEAVVALDHTDREAHREAVLAALADDHNAVRRNALITLYKRVDPDIFEHAVSLVEDESDRVREWVAIVLGRVDTDRARPELRRLAADDSDVVARAAQSALEGDTEAADTGQGPAPQADRFDQPPDL